MLPNRLAPGKCTLRRSRCRNWMASHSWFPARPSEHSLLLNRNVISFSQAKIKRTGGGVFKPSSALYSFNALVWIILILRGCNIKTRAGALMQHTKLGQCAVRSLARNPVCKTEQLDDGKNSSANQFHSGGSMQAGNQLRKYVQRDRYICASKAAKKPPNIAAVASRNRTLFSVARTHVPCNSGFGFKQLCKENWTWSIRSQG